MTDKHCKFCNKDKDPEEFPKNRAMKDGRDGRCKDCWRIYSAEKRARKTAGPSAKFSKQAPVKAEKKVVEPEVPTAEIKKVMDRIELVAISHLNKLPGLGKYWFEWTGTLPSGLALYKQRYGIHATTVYQFTGKFPRFFIGQ